MVYLSWQAVALLKEQEGAEVSWDDTAAQVSMLLNLGLSFLLQKGLVSSGVLKIGSLTSNNIEIKHLC